MNRKLTAKVQKIVPQLPQSSGSFANVITIIPEDQALIERKGALYSVFDISGGQEFDVTLVTKVVHDVLNDSYFHSDNVSPIQSLEKAVVEVKDRVTKLTNETIRDSEGTVNFNMVVTVLWGNVTYLVQYGRAGSFLMREGNIKPINSNTEGHFSAASGVVKDDDVIFIASQKFMETTSPDKLLSASVETTNLPVAAACLILKFVVDTSFTEKEVVDFSMKERSLPSVSKAGILTTIRKIFKRKPKADSAAGIKLKPENRRRFKIRPSFLIGGAGILLLASLGFTWRNNGGTFSFFNKAEEDPILSRNINSDSEEKPSENEPAPSELIDKTVFYDLRITDPTVSPTAIAVVGDTIVVSDKTSGKIYVSGREVPKFTPLEKTFPGASYLSSVDRALGLSGTSEYSFVNVSSGELSRSVTLTGEGPSAVYLGNVYAVSGNTLTKYPKDGDSTVWATSTDFEGARSISISVSIFILTKNGELISYTSGQKDNFALSGLNVPLSNPVQVLTDYDFKYIYIADSGNRRIVVVDKKGAYVKELKHEDPIAWGAMKGISVTSDESALYVLDGAKVHEIAL
jgi:hypothetical protein